MKLSISVWLAASVVASTATAQSDEQFIVGGDTASRGYNFYAQYAGDPLCGATLVHKDILIGAASCCAPETCVTYMGSNSINTGEQAVVQQYAVHPGFGYTQFGGNNIMAMKLSGPVDYNPVDYNSDNAIPKHDDSLTIIGYGLTSAEGAVSTSLMETNIDTIDFQFCEPFYNQVNRYSQICAGRTGRDFCDGDQGGPLLYDDGGLGTNFKLVGIASHHDSCASAHPGVYTQVSAYYSWIQEAICCMSGDPPNNCISTSCSGSFGTVKDCDTAANANDRCPRTDISVNDGGNGVCLSPEATALVEGKGKVSIKDVVVGDKVMTGSGDYKTVFTVAHSHPSKPTNFVQIHTNIDNENAMELTPSHMLFLHDKQHPVPAKDVKVGDFVQTLNGPQEVTDISAITRNGLYNPVTTDGTILVDGIVTSTYISLNGGSFLEIAGVKLLSFQSLLEITVAPYRAICMGVSLDLCTKNDESEYSSIVERMMQFHDFWLQQNALVQVAIFLGYVSLFSFVSLALSPYGVLFVSAILGLLTIKAKKRGSSAASMKKKQAI